MKRILFIVLVFSALAARAQYNNEWIDYNKTYYKFPVAKDGLHRITQAVLQAAGLSNTPVEYFQLWRNGIQVPLYTSVATGTLDAAGYLEFWGEMNDGKPDTRLYRNINDQLSDKWSLETDTASYFLTVNPAGANFRVENAVNDVAGNMLPAEPYFMYTYGKYYKNRINPGYAGLIGEYIYSSAYDKGEGYTSGDIRPANPLNETVNNLYVYAGGPDATFFIAGSGNALYNRSLRVSINNTQVVDVVMNVFNDQRHQVTLPAGLISAGTATIKITNASENPNDRMVISRYEITYPRQFNFGNSTNFIFELPATDVGNFLRITNFNRGSAAPVLYDLSNRKRYTGDISESGVIKFVLPPSVQKRKLVLMNMLAANINMVSTLTTRNFIDYGAPDYQGNYLIISNSLLYNGANGNPVEAYAQYRSSAVGGSYNAKIYTIDQLTDQFAFGIKRHPAAIKNFIKYAEDIFTAYPQAVFLIGKGVNYIDARTNQANPLLERLNLVPSFGHPASDNLLVARDNETISSIPVGRLSAVLPSEVEVYLEKVKEYESVGANAPQTVAGRAWMKNIVHAIGGGNPTLTAEISGYMNNLKAMIEDTLFGGRVSSFSKSSVVTSQLSSEGLKQLFAEGVGIVNYFGHSSSSTIEFNIDDPYSYDNAGKYPIFFVNGCLAGDIFMFEPNRLTTLVTLSEKYMLANERGSIGFVASSHYGVVNYLSSYLNGLYKAISQKDYGHSIGKMLEESFRYLQSVWGNDFFARVHAEEITLHGDPVVNLYMQSFPDYVAEERFIELPPVISLSDPDFKLSVKIFNIGKASPDSIDLEVERQLPDGSLKMLMKKRVRGIANADDIELTVPINPAIEKGENKIIVTIDRNNEVQEVSEMNNTVTKSFYIIEDVAQPVYPQNLSIIKEPAQRLYASTADPLSRLRSYVMEIDTTEVFNSPSKIVRTVSSVGGILEFNPQFTYIDSTVYYWRVSPVPTQDEDYRWSNYSFMYKMNTEGYNQSHYFQHRKSSFERIHLDSASRKWEYDVRENKLFIRNCIYQPGCQNANDFVVAINDVNTMVSACIGKSLMFNVLDSVTLKPWLNVDENGNNLYRYGSASANCGPGQRYNFEFSYLTPANRKLMMAFMDSIPEGAYVIVRSFDYNDPNSYSQTWKGDTTLYGSNNSLYHKLKEAGFEAIDSLNQFRAWIFVYQKGRKHSFTPQYVFGHSFSDKIQLEATCITPDTLGFITSPRFGPAKEWNKVLWNGRSLENPSSDNPVIEIIGIDNNNNESVLFTLKEDTKQFDISSVSTSEYPHLRLRIRNVDSANHSPYQLDYWRILYSPVPEGAIAPNIYFESKDTVDVGEQLKFGVAFKNISPTAFDSLKVEFSLLDKNNLRHALDTSRRKVVVSGDTVRVEYIIDNTKDYPGLNTLVMNFNPDNDQAEQYLLNNFVYKSVYIRPDNLNPLLDVTFDGVHILNNDIVSATPHILIKLKDDNRFLALDDTSLLKVQVRYPDRTLKTFSFNSDTLRFTPSSLVSGGTDNTANIDFNPSFLEDGDYELIVSGRDKSGNTAGQTAYTVAFKIINKPMISNMFNYPNPFTTSTAFVFTLTGSDIPQNIRIQILTITGKIVREITKEELGPIRIGRNITEFKWDGTDQYGQKLANGVYLYRVITNLKGKSLDKYKTESDHTDQYFNKGYGKMYLMR